MTSPRSYWQNQFYTILVCMEELLANASDVRFHGRLEVMASTFRRMCDKITIMEGHLGGGGIRKFVYQADDSTLLMAIQKCDRDLETFCPQYKEILLKMNPRLTQRIRERTQPSEFKDAKRENPKKPLAASSRLNYRTSSSSQQLRAKTTLPTPTGERKIDSPKPGGL